MELMATTDNVCCKIKIPGHTSECLTHYITKILALNCWTKTSNTSILCDSDDDFRSGCRNVGQCHQQQSFSGLLSPGQSNHTNNSDDDFRSGCRNVGQCHQQQSFLGLLSPGQSNHTNDLNSLCINPFTTESAKSKLDKFSKTTGNDNNKQLHNTVLLNSFPMNGHSLEFCP